MKQKNKNPTTSGPEQTLLVTAQRKLLKPRIQNKLILAFVFTAVISIAVSTYLVIRITSELMENEIERKIREANLSVLSVVDQAEEDALLALKNAIEKPGFFDALKIEKVPYIFTPPISAGREAPIGLWVPTGRPVTETGLAPPTVEMPTTMTKTIMQTEINDIQTLLAGAIMPISEDDRHYGTLAVGYVLGKSFAQDLEIMTGANIRIFIEKLSTGPSSIFFKGSSFELSEAATQEIKEIAKSMLEHPGIELIVEGHTDSTGSERNNYYVGLKRAEAVKEAFIAEGLKASRIQTKSFGESRPIAPETDDEGMAMNRRVELEFKTRGDSMVGAIQDLPMTTMIKQSIFSDKQRYYDRDALLKGDPYRAIYQPLVGYGGKVLGLIFVGIPKKYTFEATVTTWHFYSIILVVGFLLAVILGYTISRGISRPIRHLYRGVLSVADGDLDQHFEAETKDEIGDLGRAFNIMTSKLRQLRELEQEVQRSTRLAALGELSAGVAHEIRNPLGVIKNSAEMLRDRIQEDSKRRELTGYIVEEVERLDKVITNFLQFARPAEPNFELMDVNDVLEHTLRFLEPETRFEGIAVKKDLASDLPKVLIDSQQLHQVFLNLFMNAFQAMNGSGTLGVQTRLASPGGEGQGGSSSQASDLSQPIKSQTSLRGGKMVTVSISDTGEGISPEIRSRIFDPFFSTKDEGVGLGLSMVHKIIENHNGRIRVRSKSGSGATFIISLPMADASLTKA